MFGARVGKPYKPLLDKCYGIQIRTIQTSGLCAGITYLNTTEALTANQIGQNITCLINLARSNPTLKFMVQPMDDLLILNPEGPQLEDITNTLDYDELYRTENLFLPPDVWEPIVRKEFITRVQSSGSLESSNIELPNLEASAPSGSRIDAAIHEIAHYETKKYHWMNHKPTASSYAYAKWADPPKDTPHRANNKRNRSELGHSTEQNSQGPQAKTGTIFRILNGAIVVNGSIEEKQYEASQKEPTKATQGDNPGTAESNQDTKICWDVEEVLQDFIEEDARLGNVKFLP